MSKTDFRSFPIKRLHIFSILLASSLSALSQAADSVAIPASKAILIDASGPAKPPKSDRYLNVEGKATGQYASFAVVRFDGGLISSVLHQKYGSRKFKVTAVKLQLGQSNASFTKDGPVVIYLCQGNPSDYSALKYPYNPGTGALKGKRIATVKFSKTGKNDTFELPKGVSEAVIHGKSLTFVIAEGSPTVAATWAGIKPTPGHASPALVLTVTG